MIVYNNVSILMFKWNIIKQSYFQTEIILKQNNYLFNYFFHTIQHKFDLGYHKIDKVL